MDASTGTNRAARLRVWVLRLMAFAGALLMAATLSAAPAHAEKQRRQDEWKNDPNRFGHVDPTNLNIGCDPSANGTVSAQPILGEANFTLAVQGLEALNSLTVRYHAEFSGPPSAEKTATLGEFLAGKPVDVDGDNLDDLTLKLAPRLDTSGTRLRQLLATNFGLQPDAPAGEYALTGLDLVVDRGAVISTGASGGGFGGVVNGVTGGQDQPTLGLKLGTDFESARVGVSIDLPAVAAGGNTTSRIGLGISSLDAGASMPRFPDHAVETVALKSSAEDGNHGYLLFAADSSYAAAASERPAIQHTLDLVQVNAGAPVPATSAHGELKWEHSPKNFAAGFNVSCPPATSLSRFGWNQEQGSSDSSLSLNFLGAEGQGIEGNGDVSLEGVLRGLPQQFDTRFEPHALTIARSAETAMKVESLDIIGARRNEHLSGQDQTPLVVHAEVDGLPESSIISATANRYGIEFTPTAALRVAARVQNFFDDDHWHLAKGMAAVPNPVGATSHVLVSANSNALGCAASDDGCPHRAVSRFAAELDGLKSAAVEKSEGAEGFTVHGDVGSAQTLRVIVHSDTRSDRRDERLAAIEGAHESPATVRGSLLDFDGTVDALPAGASSLEIDGSDANPLTLLSRTPSPIAQIVGSARLALPGDTDRQVHASVVLGGPGSAVPTSADVVWKAHRDSEHHTNENTVTYNASSPVRVQLGAAMLEHARLPESIPVWSDDTVRVWTDTVVPKSVNVTWDKSADGKLKLVDMTGCGLFADPCHNDVHAVVTGSHCSYSISLDGRQCGAAYAPWDASDAELLKAPALPDVTTEVGDAGGAPHPSFTSWGPDERGVRAVVMDRQFGVEARVVNVKSVHYAPAPETVCVQSSPGDQRFLVNVLKADDGSKSLYVDAIVTRLPHVLGAQVADDGGEGDTPWLWASSTRCAGDLSRKHTGGEESTSFIDAIVRYGDHNVPLNILGKPGKVGFGLSEPLVPDTGARPNTAPGITTRVLSDTADAALSPGKVAVHAHVREPLPGNLQIWKPNSVTCDETLPGDQPMTCQSFPAYEADRWQEYALRYATDLDNLGPLDLVVGKLSPRPEGRHDERISVAVQNVPGSLKGTLRLTSNRRFPRDLIDGHFHSNRAIERIAVQYFDLDHKAHYGEPGELAFNAKVPNYSVVLRNIPNDFKLTGKLYLGNEQTKVEDTRPHASEASKGCKDANYNISGEPGLGYFHADLDLGNRVSHAAVSANPRADDREDHLANSSMVVLQGDDGAGNRVPFASGKFNLRANHLAFGDKKTAYSALGGLPNDPVTSGGFIPLPGSTEGDNHIDACVDLDLPVFLQFTNRSKLTIGSDLAVVNIGQLEDEFKQWFPTVPKVEIRERNLTGAQGDDLLAVLSEGAFYRRHYFTFHAETGWNAPGINDTNVRKPIALIPADSLRAEADDAYAKSPVNESDVYPAGTGDGGKMGFSDTFIDVLLDQKNRDALKARDDDKLAVGRPGTSLYKALVDLMPQSWHLNEPGTPVAGATKADGATVIDAAKNCSIDTDKAGTFKPTSSYVPHSYHLKTGALGSDGTKYWIAAKCGRDGDVDQEAFGPTGRRLWDVGVEAVWPNGRARWLAVNPRVRACDGPVSPQGENCKLHYTFLPDPQTGGLTAIFDWQRLDGDGNVVSHDTWTERYDASGGPQAAELRAPDDTPTDVHIDPNRRATLDGCATGAAWVCSPASPGVTRYWVFGDGDVERSPSTSFAHTYPAPGHYFGMVVDTGTEGGTSIARREVFEVSG